MERNRRTKNSIVPGRRMLTTQVAMYNAGIHDENRSYLAEKTADESSLMDCSEDREERMLRKQGYSEREILKMQEERVQKKHADAEARLEREKYGANNFEEMLNLPQYSMREPADDDDDDVGPQENVFAVPALPKRVNETSIVLSPAGRVVGKPGFGCSTPKGGKDVSMRSLRTLDISHVVNTSKLHSERINIQGKNVVISMKRTSDADEESSLEKTHTIRNDGTFTVQKDDSVQRTLIIIKDPEEDLQATFTKETAQDAQSNSSRSSSLQGTFVKRTDGQDQESVKDTEENPAENRDSSASLQGTFIKPVDSDENKNQNTLQVFESSAQNQSSLMEETVTDQMEVVHNTTEGGKNRRKSKKMDLGEREKRNADITSSLISSMIDDAPSPGARLFQNNRKKMRPTMPTPPRAKFGSRLSTDSDKEKTIDMLSIAEDATLESNGSSFVDPISVNGSRVSPIPEKDETQPMEISATPKSSRRTTGIRPASVEKSRGPLLSPRISMAPCLSDSVTVAAVTPTRNYEKPTASSLAKNKNPAEAIRWEALKEKELGKINRQTPKKTPVAMPLAESSSDEEEEQAAVTPVNVNRSPAPDRLDESMDEPTVYADPVNSSIGNVESDLNALSVNDRFDAPAPDFDLGPDYDREPQSDGEDEVEDRMPSPVQRARPKSSRRGIALLSESMVTVNTPGIADRRPTRNRRQVDDTVVDDGWNSDDDDSNRRGRRRNGKQETGLQLAKRKIIEPEDAGDGLRRSTRTRVKPLRSWLGEQAVYVNSPSGGKRLKGVTDVIIKDKRLCKYRTADLRVATEREQKEKARKKARAEQRRRQLVLDQSMGRRLNESQDDIHTSDDEL